MDPSDIFLKICAGIATVCIAASWLLKIIKAFRAPEESQNNRSKKVEEELEKHAGFLDNDKQRLDAIEEGQRVTQRALLALLSHGIDGNDIDAMKDSKKELQNYLIKR